VDNFTPLFGLGSSVRAGSGLVGLVFAVRRACLLVACLCLSFASASQNAASFVLPFVASVLFSVVSSLPLFVRLCGGAFTFCFSFVLRSSVCYVLDVVLSIYNMPVVLIP